MLDPLSLPIAADELYTDRLPLANQANLFINSGGRGIGAVGGACVGHGWGPQRTSKEGRHLRGHVIMAGLATFNSSSSSPLGWGKSAARPDTSFPTLIGQFIILGL